MKNKLNKMKISPYWITGMFDAEGNFSINHDSKTNKITVSIKVTQLEKSSLLLLMFKEYFECGNLSIDNKINKALKFQLSDVKLLIEKIIPHFDKYPLQTSKQLDFLAFKQAVILIKESRVKNKDKILTLKDTMNNNRTFKEKWQYMLNRSYNIQSEWLQGFINGEGCFYFYISKSGNTARGTLEIAQHTCNVKVLEEIKIFLNLGYIKPKFEINSLEKSLNVRSVSRIIITNTLEIIKFIDSFPMYSTKNHDFSDWKLLVEMNKSKHLNNNLELMRRIKSGMNVGKGKADAIIHEE